MAAKNDILRDKDGNQIFPATTAEQVSYDGKINVKQAIKRGAVRNKVAPTVASMTDKEQIYVYTGTEEGYTFGNWYYWDGTAWTSGGAYNAIEVNTDGTLTEEGAPADAKATGDKLSELKDDLDEVDSRLSESIVDFKNNTFDIKIHKNLYVETTYQIGYWNPNTGALSLNNDYVAIDDYISVDPSTNYVLSLYNKATNVWYGGLGSVVVFYDVNKQVIRGGASPSSATGLFTTGETTRYIRVSYTKAAHSNYNIQLEKGSTHSAEYQSTKDSYVIKKECLPNELNTSVIVDINGNGDYTSFSRAIKETTNNVIVKSGIYNIVDEFRELFGDDVWTTFNADSEFGQGILITGRKVTFEAGAKLVCDLTGTGYVVDGGTKPYHNFSVLYLGKNATIQGMNCYAKGVYYVVHDDYPDDEYWENVIQNCVIIGENIRNVNVIGGGVHKHSTHRVIDCYLEDKNRGTDGITFRYHGITGATEGNAQVEIKGNYTSGRIGIRWYGREACKYTAIVHNNVCGGELAIGSENESVYPTNTNLTVCEWGNTIHN